MERIYLDNAATTRVRPEAAEVALRAMTEIYGNASSVHAFGREAKKALEKARAQVAALPIHLPLTRLDVERRQMVGIKEGVAQVSEIGAHIHGLVQQIGCAVYHPGLSRSAAAHCAQQRCNSKGLFSHDIRLKFFRKCRCS